jgi:hypothetical protein
MPNRIAFKNFSIFFFLQHFSFQLLYQPFASLLCSLLMQDLVLQPVAFWPKRKISQDSLLPWWGIEGYETGSKK